MKLEDLAKTTDADLASERTTSNIDILKTEFEVFIARGKAELKKLNAAEKKEVTDFIRSLKNDFWSTVTPGLLSSSTALLIVRLSVSVSRSALRSLRRSTTSTSPTN